MHNKLAIINFWNNISFRRLLMTSRNFLYTVWNISANEISKRWHIEITFLPFSRTSPYFFPSSD